MGGFPFTIHQGQVNEMDSSVAELDINFVQIKHQIFVVEVNLLHPLKYVDTLEQKVSKLLSAEDACQIELQRRVCRNIILEDVIPAALNRCGGNQHRNRAGGKYFNFLRVKMLSPA